jgi:beta-carotene hydroxylase
MLKFSNTIKSTLVFLISLYSLFFSYYQLVNFNLKIPYKILLFFLIAFSLHYFLNLVHIGTHKMISKNDSWNNFIGFSSAIFGGVTFADFKSTHLLHHKNPTNPKLDPDFYITNGISILLIPFKIIYHDIYFWKHGLWKNNLWMGYLLTRFIQISIVFWFFLSKNLEVWVFFWLCPIFLVGTLNGFFLFYFPHYSTKWEKNARKRKDIWTKPFLKIIDISRIYHQEHHKNTNSYLDYFPVLSYLKKDLKKSN